MWFGRGSFGLRGGAFVDWRANRLSRGLPACVPADRGGSAGAGTVQVWGLALGLLALAVPSSAQAPTRGQAPRRTLEFSQPASPMLLAGVVVLEDGTPPPEPVVVQRVCHGGPPVAEAYTNSKGQFTIELGRDSTAGFGAEYGSTGAVDVHELMGCELRAALTGYTSDAIDLGARRVMDDPNVGEIVLRRLEGVTGSVFSTRSMRASQEARKAFEKGRKLAKDEKLDEARDEYEKAVRLFPEFASAWYELGLVHEMQHQPEDARAAYDRAIVADPEYIKPYRRLSMLAFEEQRWEEVAEMAGRIVELDPVSYTDAHIQFAAASFFLGNAEAAERSARTAIDLDAAGAAPNARYLLGVILLQKGDYPGAEEYLGQFVAMAAPGPDVDRAKSLLEQIAAAGDDGG